jgi:hypothetical protein
MKDEGEERSVRSVRSARSASWGKKRVREHANNAMLITHHSLSSSLTNTSLIFNLTFGVPKVEKFEIRISKFETTAPTEHLTKVLFTRRFEICHA